MLVGASDIADRIDARERYLRWRQSPSQMDGDIADLPPLTERGIADASQFVFGNLP